MFYAAILEIIPAYPKYYPSAAEFFYHIKKSFESQITDS